MLKPTTPSNLYGRFWNRVLFTPHGCWEWGGGLSKDSYHLRPGYGKIKIRQKSYQAHRIAYELEVGPIPEGLELDHLCRNKRCVRPDHLDPVTRSENIVRRMPFDVRPRKERA